MLTTLSKHPPRSREKELVQGYSVIFLPTCLLALFIWSYHGFHLDFNLLLLLFLQFLLFFGSLYLFFILSHFYHGWWNQSTFLYSCLSVLIVYQFRLICMVSCLCCFVTKSQSRKKSYLRVQIKFFCFSSLLVGLNYLICICF